MRTRDWWIWQLLSVVIGVAGIWTVVDAAGWQVALGVVVAMWGNNLMMATKK